MAASLTVVVVVVCLAQAFLLPHCQTLVLALVSCLFDGSCVVFQVLSSLHERTGASRAALFIGYAGFSLPLYMTQAYLWRRNKPGAQPAAEDDDSEKPPRVYGSVNITAGDDDAEHGNGTAAAAAAAAPPRMRVDEMALTDQLFTREFAFILLFASVGIFRANLYIATNESLLDRLGDNVPGPRARLYAKVRGRACP